MRHGTSWLCKMVERFLCTWFTYTLADFRERVLFSLLEMVRYRPL
jgi:hypothetical protein